MCGCRGCSCWKSPSFQIIAGMLSGPKALEGFKNSVAVLSSLMVKGDVSIGKVSDIGTLGRVQLSGTFAFALLRYNDLDARNKDYSRGNSLHGLHGRRNC